EHRNSMKVNGARAAGEGRLDQPGAAPEGGRGDQRLTRDAGCAPVGAFIETRAAESAEGQAGFWRRSDKLPAAVPGGGAGGYGGGDAGGFAADCDAPGVGAQDAAVQGHSAAQAAHGDGGLNGCKACEARAPDGAADPGEGAGEQAQADFIGRGHEGG